MRAGLSLAIIGGGMGGLAVAAILRRFGMDARIYEQAPRFARVGAGIQMMPNAMKVLREIGIEQRLRRTSFAPTSHLNRVWDTGEVTRELPMPESLHGAPYLCMHRADLHAALLSALPAKVVHLDKKLLGLDPVGARVVLTFADGSRAHADAVIGADGVHSVVRDVIIGGNAPLHNGRIAYRAVFSGSPPGRSRPRRIAHQMVGSRPTSSSITPTGQQASSTLSPACRSRRIADARILVGKGRY